VKGLDGVAAHVARRVARLRGEEPLETLRARPLYLRAARDLAPAVAPGARVSEVRFADPDHGALVPVETATAQEAGRRAADAAARGADAVAIWVERNFHAGDYSHLEAARAACPDLTLIARDVIVDPWQIERARAAGADAVELLPDLLGPALAATAAAVRALGLTPVTIDSRLTVRLV
jgi:indole-3-glycerol phosphate synthase